MQLARAATDASTPDSNPARQPYARPVLGRGRSGIVYLDHDRDGAVAAKSFRGDRLADLVHLAVSGAPCPYRWSPHAVECARLRRQILVPLVQYWFNDRLAVAPALRVTWNRSDRAWELHTRFIEGYPTALHHPFSAARDGEQQELAQEIMRPLQNRLEEAGFDGLVWQAGRGNPVAANNFLLSERRHHPRARTIPARWHWIDLESGVPALFALDPRALFGFYLPRSYALGRPIFDDVDTAKLCAYLQRHAAAIGDRLGSRVNERLLDDTRALARHQQTWRSMSRLDRSLTAALGAGRITFRQGFDYRQRPWTWWEHEIVRVLRGGLRLAPKLIGAAVRRVVAARPLRLLSGAAQFAVSQRYRARVARVHVLRRVRYWQRRHQIGPREAAYLRRVSNNDDQATYLTDFGVHLAIKPLYKPFTLFGLPLLGSTGILPLWAVAGGMLMAGSIVRSAYTSARIVQATLQGRPRPWIALAVGAIPVVGSIAFPAQLLHTSRGRDGKLAALIVYDVLTTIGRKIPIWGGEDTATEHWFNRLADLVIRDRGPIVGLR